MVRLAEQAIAVCSPDHGVLSGSARQFAMLAEGTAGAAGLGCLRPSEGFALGANCRSSRAPLRLESQHHASSRNRKPYQH